MTKRPSINTLTNTASPTYLTQLNQNFTNIKNQFDNTLSLDGSLPNAMNADIDLNGNDLINGGTLSADDIVIGGTSIATQVSNAATSATNAAASATSSAASATTATQYTPAYFNNFTALKADTRSWPVGQLLNTRAEGFAYQVVSSGQHLTTAGGVKLIVLPGDTGYNVKAFGAVGDGATNDATVLSAITAFPTSFPPGTYKVDSDVKGLGKQFSGFGSVKFSGAGRVQTSTVLGIGALANGTGFDTTAPTLTDKNVAIGTRAMFNSTTAYHCVAVGDEALYSQTTGSQNTAVGLNSQYYLTTGDGNTSVGVSSLRDNITGINNTAVGRSAGFAVLGNYNTLMGRNCAWQKTAGDDDVLVGANTMWNTTTGGLGLNTAVGHQAYYSATTPKSNVGIGWYAGFGVTTGQQQVLIGAETGFADAPTGQVAVGYQALKNGTGLYNVAMGSTALVSLTTGYSHTAVGYQAGFSSTTGYYNTYLGYRAGRATITSTGNTYIGADAGWRATGETNTVVGSNSFSASSTATASTIVGRNAGLVLASGSGNTFIGEQAGNLQTAGSNNILIGQSVNAPSVTGSNQVVISTGQVGMWLGITGTPEGVITAAVGSIATRADGGASTTFYVKQSGSGNTGWVAK